MRITRQAWLGALLGACASGSVPSPAPTPAHREPVSIATTQTDRKIAAMEPAKLEGGTGDLDRAIASFYERSTSKRTYLMTDKPLYQPGETIWFRADLRSTGTLMGGGPIGLLVTLTSPRGSIVAQKRVLAQAGIGRNDFKLAAEIEGGEYTLSMVAEDGTATDSKQIVINTYEAPRLQKSLELLRKAYGEGDNVSAAIEIKRSTGEPFAEQTLAGIVTIDDVEQPRLSIKTDKDGKATARFALPAKLSRGDGLLTILVTDGGVTESIQKRIPIVMKTIQFSMFPEGGDLVDDVPGRVYFLAKTTLGKPADVEGKVVDEKGKQVAELSSVHDGMGRFEITPGTDRKYQVVITKPAGITSKFDVPQGKAGGCVIRSVDQKGTETLRIGAICNTARKLAVEAVMREKRLASGTFDVAAGQPTMVELPIPANTQGAVRVTLFSSKNEPLAERLVYHGMGADLKISMTANKKTFSPRDPVKLQIKTTDASGKPVKANVGVAVVDETVLAFADDKSGNILSRLFLEQELGATKEDPIEDPKYYFGTKPDATAALDALLATRGYRRFEWRPILNAIPATGGAQ
jgi:alpha-2-macroglobulin-like protein